MELFKLPVRWGGLGILDPTKAAESSYELSFSATSMVREAILGDEPLDVLDTVPIMLASSGSAGRRGRRSSRIGMMRC